MVKRRLAVMVLACLPLQWVLACSCMHGSNLSDRWYFAEHEAVAEVRVISTETLNVIATDHNGVVRSIRQEVVAEVRQAWMDPSLLGRQLTFVHRSESLSSCTSPELFQGATWITGIKAGRIPDGSFAYCGLAKHRSVNPAKAAYFARLEREFMQRKKMSDEDWIQLLAPLRDRAASWAQAGAQSCVQRLDSQAPSGFCHGQFERRAESFWALGEDPSSESAAFYAFARSPMGALRMWSAPLVQKQDASLALDLSNLREQHCDWIALSADNLEKVCRINR